MNTITDFFGILKDTCRFFPQGEKEVTPQAFAVVRSAEELNLQNLGKSIADKDRPFFWSRKWAAQNYNPSAIQWEYPAVVAVDLGYEMENPVKGVFKQVHTVHLYVVYPNVQVHEAGQLATYCKPLLVGDIYENTRGILHQIIRGLNQFKLYTVDGAERFLLPGHAQVLEDAGATVSEVGNGVVHLNRLVQRTNNGARVNYVDDIGNDFICGVQASFDVVTFDCPTPAFEFSQAECLVDYDKMPV